MPARIDNLPARRLRVTLTRHTPPGNIREPLYHVGIAGAGVDFPRFLIRGPFPRRKALRCAHELRDNLLAIDGYEDRLIRKYAPK